MATSVDQPITVLHVDDEPDFGDLVADILERKFGRFSVETATSANNALDRLSENSIECIVSDYDMPGQNGIDFLQSVRDFHPDLPFILFTGKGSEEVASEAISKGVTDYLQKGRGMDQYTVLANRVANAVEKHRAERLVARAYDAMDSAREGIALLDEAGKFIYVNDAYSEIVGYDQEELLDEFWELVYPDDQVDRIYEEILPAVPEEGYWSGDTVYRRKDGNRILVNHALAYSEEGTMICLLRDFTDDELQDRTLNEERQRFDLFIQAVEEYAIFMLDTEGYIVTWNEGAERIKGYREEEILGDHISTFYTQSQEDEGLPDRLLNEAKTSGSVTHEGPRVRKDGSTFDASVVITAVYDETGSHRGYGKVTRDLTGTPRQLNDDF